ncbi:hypothetical protein GCM10010913_42870 [Paenibacillus aceti]|uniref:Uncharacterized protein n=1 Tax=Paenibacillus aceti TaxID=1820010 RepID=A0ABQ1W691_9BACL|nr:hypothetical protein GCM10010913_42870 [Paenibacillus aceti]
MPRMERILNTYRAEALPIIHVVRLYNGDGSNVDLCRQEAVEKGAQNRDAAYRGS